jgi:prevent-host-death family protein
MRGAQLTTRTMDVSEAREQLGTLVDRVARKETRILVARGGVLVAALVSADDLVRLDQMDREQADRFEVLDEMRAAFAGVPEEEIERETDRIIARIREEDDRRAKAPTGR